MDLHSLGIRISRSENLPILPNVLIEILRLYEGPHTSPRSLEKVIEQDAALTGKILRVASSSMYGFKSGTSVNRAVSVLGVNTLRSIAVSLGYQQLLEGKRAVYSFDRKMFGRHCMAVAVGSKQIARKIAPAIAEEMYVAGLIHDIGILTLERYCPNPLALAIKKAQFNRVTLCQAEKEVFGFDHYEVGGLLAEKWKLSPTLMDAIRYHQDPHLDEKNPLSTAIVIGASFLAYECGYPEMKDIEPHHESEQRFKELGLSDDQIEEIKYAILAEVELSDKTYGEQPVAA